MPWNLLTSEHANSSEGHISSNLVYNVADIKWHGKVKEFNISTSL